MVNKANSRPVTQSLKEYARGIAGGLLFSFPMLYTMEVWWAGFIAKPSDLLILMLVTFLLLLGYNRYAGMHPGVTWRSVVVDSFEELGLGLLLSFAMLLILNRIHFNGMGLDEVMGKVIIEAMAVSIGVSVGTAQLGTRNDEQEEEEEVARDTKSAMVVLALCGAIIVGGNVAPTEEVLLIAVEATPAHILFLALVSVLLCMIVVYFSDFRGTIRGEANSLAFNITFDTCLSYLIALAASAFMLWFFGRFDGESLWTCVAQSVVLGVITSLGASAGRLLIK
ncbi:TIGR02587 family membrane protein [uncultured Pontibacter sp.]|uniref:TIGR02587 family membrane protein n=1 Tax=uncultured Pontibacter sp. TaxID=453356 RepID=UPI00262C4567|nr:TIGR02587 family membrane protein [uncultured Pontibacter sp.]